MIQSSLPTSIGGAGVPSSDNRMGAWVKVLDPVLATSTWVNWHLSFIDSLQPAIVFGTVNLELGIGPVGSEERVWKSKGLICGGSELEFDDSWWTGYVPFNFEKDQLVHGRLAFVAGSFPVLLQLQIHLHS